MTWKETSLLRNCITVFYCSGVLKKYIIVPKCSPVHQVILYIYNKVYLEIRPTILPSNDAETQPNHPIGAVDAVDWPQWVFPRSQSW